MSFSISDLEKVLGGFPEYVPGHPLGRPFATAYQIAIRFAERFPDHPDVLSLPIGGAGTGEYQSLAQKIAWFLSQQIRDGKAGRIEGGFLSHECGIEMSFVSSAATITPSTLRSEHAQSIFRLGRM